MHPEGAACVEVGPPLLIVLRHWLTVAVGVIDFGLLCRSLGDGQLLDHALVPHAGAPVRTSLAFRLAEASGRRSRFLRGTRPEVVAGRAIAPVGHRVLGNDAAPKNTRVVKSSSQDMHPIPLNMFKGPCRGNKAASVGRECWTTDGSSPGSRQPRNEPCSDNEQGGLTVRPLSRPTALSNAHSK